MSNYSTLAQNTLAGLSEPAQCLYLKLLDQFEGHSNRANERRAFWEACRFDHGCGGVLDYVMRNSPAHDLDDEAAASLSRFFAERWRNNFMGRA